MIDQNEAVLLFRDFYKNKDLLKETGHSKRVIIDLNEIRSFNKDLLNFIVNDPQSILPYLAEDLNIENIGFKGSLGKYNTNPREINSLFISKLISVQGIVTSVSLIRPKIKKSVHYDEIKKEFYQKDYRDYTMIGKLPITNTVYPLAIENRILNSEFGYSHYIDFQSCVLQEMPENSPPGQLPRSIEIILTEDLADKIKPGDRVTAYGIYKTVAVKNIEMPNKFKTILIVNNLEVKNREGKKQMDFDFSLISQSNQKFKAVAPSIFGHDDIKKALALLLVGGNEINMKNGSKIRGDINILLIGDPSTAKSQLLRYVINFSPLTIATTGKGSSGVGLTAAIVKDKETGEKRLEAGAMVLGDRGIVCIDEFDKMSDYDRVAIHEVMEQQTVSISKAGIHTTLNARVSVLAAANPIFGIYNEKMSPQENIRIESSLLTRFDLIFITLDNLGKEQDEKISSHVIENHRNNINKENEVISQDLFKEFIKHAKQLRPKLSKEAASIITKEYTKMRENKENKSLVMNITPRYLETMIRLSTAHAKLRLSEVVEEEDINEILRILKKTLYFNKIRRNTKITKENIILDEFNRETKVSTNKELISNEERYQILKKIWDWRDQNQNEEFMEIVKFCKENNLSEKTIQEIAEDLSKQDLVLYEDGKIYFLE